MKTSFLGKIVDRAEHLSHEELVRYLSRLARENGVLETVFEALKEGVVVLNREGVMRYINPGACQLLPFPQSLPERPQISHYLKEINWEALLANQQSVSRLLEIDYPEHRILDFSLLPVELPSEQQDGELEAGFVGIFYDVTRQHRQTREVIESERVNAVTMLAAGVAHELGNPINNLNIHLQLMERDTRKLPDKSRKRLNESIGIAREEVKRLDTIIHEFLQAIRPTVPELRPVNLQAVLCDTLELLKREISNQHILVELDFEEKLPIIQGDEGQLKQVFYNLIKNALQAMAEKGILTVEGKQEGSWLSLSFRDNGEGISMENIPQVMQPFYTTKKRGTGLGLMIVQRIVHEHGGQLEIESNHGQGTTVRIKFPWESKQVKLLE
ncbi:MAG: ATP-binding protein [Verrucomicrobiota bacterium]